MSLRWFLGIGLVVLFALSACASAPKRPVPDYDGRPEPTTAGEVLLWAPRVIVSPLYLIGEHVVRRPLSVLVPAVERVQLPQPTAGPSAADQLELAVLPSVLVDVSQGIGGRISGGAYLLGEGLLADGHELRLRVTYGTFDWFEVDFENGYELGEAHELALVLGYHRRDDAVFAGIGPDVDADDIGRYGVESLDVALRDTLAIGGRGGVVSALGLRHTSYFAGVSGEPDERSVDERVADGRYPYPAALDTGHTQLVPRFGVVFDSRDTAPADETGVRFTLDLEYGHELDGDAASYLRVTSVLGAYVDMFQRRTIGLRLHTSLTEPTSSDPLSFADLSPLGGQHPMRAFIDGELRGRSSVVAALEYRWPVWVWLDGQLVWELGNVFGASFDGLDVDRLRMSFGLGVCAPLGERHPFEVMIAAGTDTVERGLTISHWRVVFGTASGFW